MSQQLTVKAQSITSASSASKQIILEIKGLPVIFGAIDIAELIRIGDNNLFIGGFNIGGSRALENSKPYISLNKTTKSVNAQMRSDKGGSTSITKFNVELVDFNNEVSEMIKSGNYLKDILSAEANVYISFEGLNYPDDATKIFNGVIDGFQSTGNSIILSIAHPERLKKRDLFLPASTELSSAMNNSQLTCTVVDAVDFYIQEDDGLSTYIKVDDEIMKFSSISGNTFTLTERGGLNTVANSHDIESSAESFYRLQGKPIDLALKLMLSGGDKIFNTTSPLSINEFALESIDNAIFFEDPNIGKTLGLVENDIVNLSGSLNGNDFTGALITEIGTVNGASYIQVDTTLVTEIDNDAMSVEFISQFNIYDSVGCGMTPEQVDVAQHIVIDELVGTSFPTYDFYIKEEINAKTFISEQIYFPVGLYSLNRKAAASIGYTAPPIALFQTKKLNADSILNPDKMVSKRSSNQNFYNTVKYNYNKDSLEDKYLAIRTTISEDSFNRISDGPQILLIQSEGIRNTPENNTFLDAQAIRFLDRYKFAAESLTVEVPYQFGFNIELGDRIQFYGADANVFLYSQGTRNPEPKIFEITDKNMNIIDGTISLTILDTVFGTSGRFVTHAPSSYVDAGATLTRIPIKKSFGTKPNEEEGDKWLDFIGSKVLIHNDDWSIQELATLQNVSDTFLSVAPLSVSPLEDFTIEPPHYTDASEEFKVLHGFNSPIVNVSGGTTTTVDVDSVVEFFVGASVRVHNEDFSRDKLTTVLEINVNTLTLEDDLGFTPVSGDFVDKIGFSDDNGDAYLHL